MESGAKEFQGFRLNCLMNGIFPHSRTAAPCPIQPHPSPLVMEQAWRRPVPLISFGSIPGYKIKTTKPTHFGWRTHRHVGELPNNCSRGKSQPVAPGRALKIISCSLKFQAPEFPMHRIVLKAADWGHPPQRRHRYHVVVHRRGTGTPNWASTTCPASSQRRPRKRPLTGANSKSAISPAVCKITTCARRCSQIIYRARCAGRRSTIGKTIECGIFNRLFCNGLPE